MRFWLQSSSGHVIMEFERQFYNTSVWSQVEFNHFERYIFLNKDGQNRMDSQGIVIVLLSYFIYTESSETECFNK